MTKYFPFARPADKPWRPLVEKHFIAEHGCKIIDYEKLRYMMPDDPKTHQYIEIHGTIGISLSAPEK